MEIVVVRKNLYLAAEMTLLQSAVSSILNRKAGKTFEESIKKLTKG